MEMGAGSGYYGSPYHFVGYTIFAVTRSMCGSSLYVQSELNIACVWKNSSIGARY